jgi:hypothetical protein
MGPEAAGRAGHQNAFFGQIHDNLSYESIAQLGRIFHFGSGLINVSSSTELQLFAEGKKIHRKSPTDFPSSRVFSSVAETELRI